MKTVRFRIAAAMAAAMLATATFVGAVASQDDSTQPQGETPTAMEASSTDASPIVYAGGFGLFPAQ